MSPFRLVFYNHTWRIDGTVYTDYNGKPIPSQIPLSAILRGGRYTAAFFVVENADLDVMDRAHRWRSVPGERAVATGRHRGVL